MFTYNKLAGDTQFSEIFAILLLVYSDGKFVFGNFPRRQLSYISLCSLFSFYIKEFKTCVSEHLARHSDGLLFIYLVLGKASLRMK